MLDFDKIKYYYNTIGLNGERLWNEEMVKNAVLMGKINEKEYKEITGKDYIA